jgi:hypothetical protein
VHLSYPNQINEIIGFLVNRTQFGKPAVKLTTVEEKYLVYLLMGLGEVLKMKDLKSKSGTRSRLSFVNVAVGYNLLIPVMSFFESNSLDVRVEVCKVFKAAAVVHSASRQLESYEEFSVALVHALSLYGSNRGNNPVDYVQMATLMMKMVIFNNPEALGLLLPVLFYLQVCATFE